VSPLRSRYFLERRVARAFGLKNYEQAIEVLSELLCVVGENPNTLHATAVCHQRLGRHDEALRLAERGISADPAHLGCLEVLAESHVARGDKKAAKQFARRALACVEVPNPDDGTRARVALRLTSRWKLPGPATGKRAPSPEWISWANGLLNDDPGVGKS